MLLLEHRISKCGLFSVKRIAITLKVFLFFAISPASDDFTFNLMMFLGWYAICKLHDARCENRSLKERKKDKETGIISSCYKLDIHHRSNPFGGILSRPVPFSDHKQVGLCQLETHHLRATRSPKLLCLLLLPRFQNGCFRPDFTPE
ncbi:hypothetical protein AVEN_204332-1 [Araneus ventricosus]|uniref:Uncharacterized protein n=1 Tax=Araneus ventricosus TaxID=182803 RepID=A0A4Y2JEW8_ARAVE|nr:hypothetical protein AVEN_204332-1 [Araneus ventricosus]